ncbi:MAG: DUF3168 domain-containing protein [Chloroflexi bacterium]|nr:DUF3168 domain-containing protein [Chloroflexota bacterium]
MTPEEALVALLTGDTTINTMIGARIYPLVVPQTSIRPAIAYQVISNVPSYTHDGPADHARERIQLTLEGNSYAQARALAGEVRRKLGGYRGVVGDLTIGSSFIENDVDSYAETTRLPVVRMDVVMQHNG